MTAIAVIENKISVVEHCLETLERYKKFSQKEIEENVDIRGAVERYLYLAAQSTIDLAEAVIAYDELRKPSSMSETFQILMERNIILPELSQKLVQMVGFRNVIAHDYAKVNYDIVFDVLQNRLNDIQQLIGAIKSHLDL
jgi:uncharacterized protein YutE (UPF0331/DUF86 family)